MRAIYTTLFSVLFIGTTATAQTYADDVAEIVYNNCTSCHHPGGVGGFSLMNYNEVNAMAVQMYDAVAQDRMPPWSPDENYQQYSHSRLIDSADKQTLLNWLSGGTPEGNPANTPAPPVYSSSSILGNGDLEVIMPNYMSKATNTSDDYICIALPTGLTQGRTIKAMEVVPGNPEIVHHCLVFIDETATYVTDTVGGDCGGPSEGKLVGGYTPGATPLIFPNSPQLKLGIEMPANSNVIFAMHYPEGSYGEWDQTKVIFHFYDQAETGIREVETAPILQNWGFTLPANQLTDVTAQYPEPGNGTIPIDISMLSVFPHMHLLGSTIKSYAIDPIGDTVKFVNIPHYDFEWQDFYFFKNLVKMPQGSMMYAEGTFDNTVNNTHNPNSPPQTVYPGLNTSDEMFLTYFHYLYYQPGDELYDLESMMSVGIEEFQPEDNLNWSAYPNPTNGDLTINFNFESAQNSISMTVYDLSGKAIKTLAQNNQVGHNAQYNWDSNTVDAGVYVISTLVNGQHYYKKVIVQ